jgi:hypothetical protein
MASDYARRGRPRGSGLDDRMQLRRIVEMLDADPNLKPTTAIKAMGVSDPSTIRRLRDKLRSSPQGGAARPQPHAGAGLSAPRAVEAIEARHAAKPARRPAATDSSTNGLATSRTELPVDPAAWFAAWYALGLHAFSSTVEAHMAMMEDLLHAPPVASALRHQLVFNEVAKAFCPKRPDIRPTLH